MDPFERHVFAQIAQSLERIPHADRADTYVIGLPTDLVGQRPITAIEYNTDSWARDAGGDWDTRWDYDSWKHGELGVVARPYADELGAALQRSHITDLGLWFEPSSTAWCEEHNEKGYLILENHMCILARSIQRLHDEKVLEDVLSRPVPVIVQSFTDEGLAGRATRDGNPACLVHEYFDGC